MLGVFLSAVVTLFVVIDPPGCAPIFAGLTRGASAAHRRTQAIRSVGIAAAILLGFALAGEPLLHTLGISLDAFRAAGGIMLFLIALEMVFERRTQRREDRAEQVSRRAADAQRAPEQLDVSVFPMAIPMIAGPGSIATMMLLAGRHHGLELVAVGLALLVVLAIMLAALLAAAPLMRLVGDQVEAAITRILGVLLAALAAQFVIDGIKASFG